MTQHDEKSVNEIRYNRHKKRQNNDLVAAMYAMYLTGVSLAGIGKVYRRSRQAVYDVFRTRGYPLRSKKRYPEMIVDGIKFTPSHRGGYWRSTSRDRNVFLHTYVWEKANGPVPAGCGIHHRNGDKGDNRIENLEMLPITEISRRYSNPEGKNQYTKTI